MGKVINKPKPERRLGTRGEMRMILAKDRSLGACVSARMRKVPLRQQDEWGIPRKRHMYAMESQQLGWLAWGVKMWMPSGAWQMK